MFTSDGASFHAGAKNLSVKFSSTEFEDFEISDHRLPVLDSAETIEIIKKYLETGNFSVFEASILQFLET